MNELMNRWYQVRGMIKDVIKTESDVGGVKLMSMDKSCSVILCNGFGDGTTRIGILKKDDEFDESLMYFNTSINGKWLIADYDCGDNAIAELNGKYGVYYYEGIVIFKEWT